LTYAPSLWVPDEKSEKQLLHRYHSNNQTEWQKMKCVGGNKKNIRNMHGYEERIGLPINQQRNITNAEDNGVYEWIALVYNRQAGLDHPLLQGHEIQIKFLSIWKDRSFICIHHASALLKLSLLHYSDRKPKWYLSCCWCYSLFSWHESLLITASKPVNWCYSQN
jgi:hypothetical protein